MITNFTSDHFESFKKCPYSYYLKYIRGLKFTDKKDIYKLGREIHALIDYKLRGLSLAKIEKTLDTATKKHWQNIQKHPLLSQEVIATEWGFDLKIQDNNWINGRVDAIFKAGDKYIIADWKTGQSLPYSPVDNYQALIYMWAFYKMQKSFGLNFKAEQLTFIFISTDDSGKEKELQCSEDMIKEIESQLIDALQQITTESNFDKDKANCTFCQYSALCE